MTPQLKKWLEDNGESISTLRHAESESKDLEKRINELREKSIMEVIDLIPHNELNKLKEEYIDWIIVESWDK
jgi:carbonic anhydrase